MLGWRLSDAWPGASWVCLVFPHGCRVAAADRGGEGQLQQHWVSVLDHLNTPSIPPEDSTHVSLARSVSRGLLQLQEGGKFHLAFQPPLKRKPEKKGVTSVSRVSQLTASDSTGEEKQ